MEKRRMETRSKWYHFCKQVGILDVTSQAHPATTRETTPIPGLFWSGTKPLWLKDQLCPVQPLNPLWNTDEHSYVTVDPCAVSKTLDLQDLKARFTTKAATKKKRSLQTVLVSGTGNVSLDISKSPAKESLWFVVTYKHSLQFTTLNNIINSSPT